MFSLHNFLLSRPCRLAARSGGDRLQPDSELPAVHGARTQVQDDLWPAGGSGGHAHAGQVPRLRRLPHAAGKKTSNISEL